MVLRCEAPGCMQMADRRAKFLDPRRDCDEERAYTIKYACCADHLLEICDELERQAQYARLVH